MKTAILIFTCLTGVLCQDAQFFSCPITSTIPGFNFQDLTGLQVAVLYNSTKDVDYFLDNGCDINYDGTYITTIEKECDNPLLKRLGISCERQVIYSGFTAIALAVVYSDIEIVRKLLQVPEINVNIASNFSSSPLSDAAGKGNLEMVQLLVEAGADVNYKGGKNNRRGSVLGFAANSGSAPVVEYLISNGAELDYLDNGGYTPLGVATVKGHSDVVRILAEAGADINQVQGKYDQTPLIFAVSGGYNDIVDYLTSKGANVNAEDIDGESALFYAATDGNLEAVKSLLSVGANVNQQNGQYKVTALFQAILGEHRDVASYLINNGADINAEDSRSYSIAYAAAEAGDPVILRAVIQAGADIDDQGGEVNWSPIMRAAYKGDIETVKILKNAGANLELEDNLGRTALDLAEERNNSEISKLLREK